MFAGSNSSPKVICSIFSLPSADVSKVELQRRKTNPMSRIFLKYFSLVSDPNKLKRRFKPSFIITFLSENSERIVRTLLQCHI